MKVLFVLELYYPNIGGIEKLFKSLAESLVKKGHEVTVVTTRFNKQLQKQELLNGVKIHRLNIKNRFIFSFLGFFFILRFARRADIIHTTSYNAAFPAWMAAKTCRKRIIITFHEVWGSLWFKLPFLNYCKRVLYYLYEQFILKLWYDHIVAVSDYTRHRLIASGVKKNRTSRIYNGLDYTCYKHGKPEPNNSFVFTYFGRLGNSKGLDILLEASSVFVQKHDNAQLKLIIPRTPKLFYKKIKRLTRRKRLESNIRILHHLNDEDLHRELVNSDCVVIPSYSEGFCFAAVEAIALGVPLISSDQGALKEVVTGKFIKMKSLDPDGLTEALESAKAGQWDELPIKIFDIGNTVDQYLNLYHELVSAN